MPDLICQDPLFQEKTSRCIRVVKRVYIEQEKCKRVGTPNTKVLLCLSVTVGARRDVAGPVLYGTIYICTHAAR